MALRIPRPDGVTVREWVDRLWTDDPMDGDDELVAWRQRLNAQGDVAVCREQLRADRWRAITENGGPLRDLLVELAMRADGRWADLITRLGL